MGKLLFIPFSLIGGVIAGFLSKKVFELAWSLVDDEDPPEPDQTGLARASPSVGRFGTSASLSTVSAR